MKKIILFSLAIFASKAYYSQSNSSYWEEVSESKIEITGKREIVPEKYKTYHLNYELLKSSIKNAPNDKNVFINNSSIIVMLPMPNGEFQRFKVVESPVMDADLQISFPDIRTYSVKGIDDEYANGKIDITEFGFHGTIRSVKGDVFIDPYCQKNV